MKHLIEREDSDGSAGSDGGQSKKRVLEYLDGSLSSDYDSEDDSDSLDGDGKLRGLDSLRDGNNSDDSIDVRKVNYR